MLSFPPPNHGAANSWIKAPEKVVRCKCISTLISFLPSLFPSLCSTSLASYRAASSSAKSHSPDLSDMLKRGLSHVSSHKCPLGLLREATPLSLIHTGLHNSRSPMLEAPRDNPSATMGIQCIQCLRTGLFPCLSAYRGRWMSINCKCLPPLTHRPTPEGTFQPKWLLTNPCSAACRPLGYSNELERRQSHSGWVLSAGDKSEQATPNTNPGLSRTLLYHIRQGNWLLLLQPDRQNTSGFDLFLVRPLKTTSDDFLLCTESSGSTLLSSGGVKVAWMSCSVHSWSSWRCWGSGMAALDWARWWNQSGSHLPPALLAALPAESRSHKVTENSFTFPTPHSAAARKTGNWDPILNCSWA